MSRPLQPPSVRISAPAKLNLGLEVIGRRPDGYHDLVTIYQAIDLSDDLALTPSLNLSLTCDDPALANASNLALAALVRLHDRAEMGQGAHAHLEKRIPVAAGLGGASSDAAAALVAGRQLWQAAASEEALAEIALSLGSDVPFFLRGGTALATGRGECLERLPAPSNAWFVVVSPAVAITDKTATLYRALTPADFSDGSAVRRQAARLRAGERLEPSLLPNAFARALYALRPDLADLPATMRRHGAPTVALAGAGPSHYAVLDDPEVARRVARHLAAELGDRARVVAAAPVDEPPMPIPT